jgi:hypothetical protein
MFAQAETMQKVVVGPARKVLIWLSGGGGLISFL